MPLSLSRFAGEAIAIGPGITVEVVAVDRFGKVRLRITAPDEVLILRSELIDRSVVLPPRVLTHVRAAAVPTEDEAEQGRTGLPALG